MEMTPYRAHDHGLVLMPDEGERLQLQDTTVDYKAVSDDTFGAWSLMQYTTPPKFQGPPVHWHRRTTEAFYVLEGVLTVHLDGRDYHVPAGGFVLITPGLVHKYSNESDQSVRFLILVSPGGFERYFDELATLICRDPDCPPADTGAYARLQLKHDTYPPD